MREIAEEYCKLSSISDIIKKHNNPENVKKIISEFNKSILLEKELYFCFGIGRDDLGFLFDNGQEKVVIINDNVVENSKEFTDYELMWLFKNYNLSRLVVTRQPKIEIVESGLQFYKENIKTYRETKKPPKRKIKTEIVYMQKNGKRYMKRL